MAFQAETNLSCPVCHGIFQDPVLLSCSHNVCNACLKRWWTEKPTRECPLCKRRSLYHDPPQNLALRNLCENFLAERAQRAAAGAEPRCSLHAKRLRLFCLDDQQLVCSVCMHSVKHTKHSIKPSDEAAQDYKCGLQYSLEALQKTLELFNNIKRNFDQTEKDIELQNTDTERQIKDAFSKLQQFLQKEEKVRIDTLREEKQQKTQMLRGKTEAVNTQITALSATITATEEALQAEDLRFLQNYKTTAERVHQPLPDVPEPIPGVLLDTDKHLNNLTSVVLDKMKEEMVTSNSEVLQPMSNTEPLQHCYRYQETSDYHSTVGEVPKNMFSLGQPKSSDHSMTNRSPKCNNEASQHRKEELLMPSPKQLKYSKEVKQNFDRMLNYIEVHAQDTEKQIQDVFLKLQQFLQKEEMVRIDAVREEKQQKSLMWKRKFEDLDTEIAVLSDQLKSYKEAHGIQSMLCLIYCNSLVQTFYLETMETMPGKLISPPLDTAQHLDNLPSVVSDKIKEMVTSNSEVLQPTTNPKTSNYDHIFSDLSVSISRLATSTFL